MKTFAVLIKTTCITYAEVFAESEDEARRKVEDDLLIGLGLDDPPQRGKYYHRHEPIEDWIITEIKE